ncbi:hypothetical protein NPIL_628991 [Nephila pilipes]|uniref:Uncharacterized protein n=1 Tax=Nephila pilipes TaxID=299642 RepID=A0A8X6QR27_NEPPI|nr:hypothetical protein NPIL_628991 [Nephila pilipes]
MYQAPSILDWIEHGLHTLASDSAPNTFRSFSTQSCLTHAHSGATCRKSYGRAINRHVTMKHRTKFLAFLLHNSASRTTSLMKQMNGPLQLTIGVVYLLPTLKEETFECLFSPGVPGN